MLIVMVRPAHRRKEKYAKGIDPEQTKRKLEALKKIMIDQASPYYGEVVEVERKTKRICERQGISTFLIGQYLIYARQLHSLSKRFESASLNAEAQWLTDLWVSRGLIGTLLIRIAALFGIVPTAPAAPQYPFVVDKGFNIVILGGMNVIAYVFPTAQPDIAYTCMAVPHWNCHAYITGKTVNGFMLRFSVAAPMPQSTFDYFVLR